MSPAFSPDSIRVIISDVKAEIGKKNCPNVQRRLAWEAAAWYEMLWTKQKGN